MKTTISILVLVLVCLSASGAAASSYPDRVSSSSFPDVWVRTQMGHFTRLSYNAQDGTFSISSLRPRDGRSPEWARLYFSPGNIYHPGGKKLVATMRFQMPERSYYYGVPGSGIINVGFAIAKDVGKGVKDEHALVVPFSNNSTSIHVKPNRFLNNPAITVVDSRQGIYELRAISKDYLPAGVYSVWGGVEVMCLGGQATFINGGRILHLGLRSE